MDTDNLLVSGLPEKDVELLRSLGRIADSRGTSAYVVGGVARDLFLGRPTSDLDVVVEEDAIDFGAAAASSIGGSVKAHTRFGTVIFVTPDGSKIDIATSRSEVYERPGALPTVSSGGIEDDLRRRDFTVNSMAFRINDESFGTLLDPHGGLDDLEAGVLRIITEKSFEDDPTRILRGIRFASRFGMSFEKGTEDLLRRAVAERRTDSVSGERLLNELVLILNERDAAASAARLIEWGILQSIHASWTVPPAVCETVATLSERLDTDVTRDGDSGKERGAALFLALLEPVDHEARVEVMDRLCAGRRVRALERELVALESDALPMLEAADAIPPSGLHRALRSFSTGTLLLAETLRSGTGVGDRLRLFTSELSGAGISVTGDDLAELGVSEGTAVGEILDKLLDAKLDGLVSSEEEERALAANLADTLTGASETDSVSVKAPHEQSEGEVPDVNKHERDESSGGTEAPPAAQIDERQDGEPAGETEEASVPADGPATTRTEDPRDREPLVRRPVYEVHLDAFDGPLDLLLHLIREHQIDIYDIPIAVITEQYLEYITFMESLDLALAGEFLEMAATLIRIKVQMLLPSDTGDEEEEDPREQLVRKLVEYKQFKEAAKSLSDKERDRREYFPKGVDPRSYAELEEDVMDIDEFLRDVTLFDLVDGLREVLARVPERVDVHSVDMEEVTVEEQIDRIRAIIRERRTVPFADIFGEHVTRFQIVATFIALLEMMRLGEIRAIQKRNFGDIEITARVED